MHSWQQDCQDRLATLTEGKLPNAFKHMQRQHLLSHHKYLTIDVWMKGFVDQLLTLTHTQWLCRNLTKHHKTMGTKALAVREEIQKEGEEQLHMGFSELPRDSRCLLEIAPDNLFGVRTADQQYWLNAARAARTACSRQRPTISAGKTNSWNDILKMPECKTKIKELPQQPAPARRPAADRDNLREGSTKRRKDREGNPPEQIIHSQQE